MSMLIANPGSASEDLEQALQLYENGNYVHAESRLRALARDGNARAAEILGFMYAIGPAVYPGVPRDPRSAIHWFDIAARGGRPVGQYMVCALRKQAGAVPAGAYRCFDWVAETGRPGPR
jgi:TPR repeat protein